MNKSLWIFWSLKLIHVASLRFFLVKLRQFCCYKFNYVAISLRTLYHYITLADYALIFIIVKPTMVLVHFIWYNNVQWKGNCTNNKKQEHFTTHGLYLLRTTIIYLMSEKKWSWVFLASCFDDEYSRDILELSVVPVCMFFENIYNKNNFMLFVRSSSNGSTK